MPGYFYPEPKKLNQTEPKKLGFGLDHITLSLALAILYL